MRPEPSLIQPLKLSNKTTAVQHISEDHVHLIVSVPPKISVSEFVKRIKGRSSRKMMEEFGELKRKYWGRHMGARGYISANTGNVTDEIIAEYIEKQSEISPEEGEQNFSVENL